MAKNSQSPQAASSAAAGANMPLRASAAIGVVKWSARIFALVIVVQVFLAGLALFVAADNWAAHANFARYTVVLPVLMIVVSFAARLPAAYRLNSIQLLVMVVLMFVTAILSDKIGFLSALHPVIAAALFWRTMTVAQQAKAA